MNNAVGVRGAIVQDKLRTPLADFPNPLVQAVLRDVAVMRPVLAQDGRAVRNGALRTASMEALLSDAGLVQRIAGLGGGS